MFNREPKINLDYIGFVLLRSVIGPENSHHSLNQSDAKLKTSRDLVTCALPALQAVCLFFIMSSHWLITMSTFALIRHCEYFGFQVFDTYLKSSQN